MIFEEKRMWGKDYLRSEEFKELDELASEMLNLIKEFVQGCVEEFVSELDEDMLGNLRDMFFVVLASQKTELAKFDSVVRKLLGYGLDKVLGVRRKVKLPAEAD